LILFSIVEIGLSSFSDTKKSRAFPPRSIQKTVNIPSFRFINWPPSAIRERYEWSNALWFWTHRNLSAAVNKSLGRASLKCQNYTRCSSHQMEIIDYSKKPDFQIDRLKSLSVLIGKLSCCRCKS